MDTLKVLLHFELIENDQISLLASKCMPNTSTEILCSLAGGEQLKFWNFK